MFPLTREAYHHSLTRRGVCAILVAGNMARRCIVAACLRGFLGGTVCLSAAPTGCVGPTGPVLDAGPTGCEGGPLCLADFPCGRTSACLDLRTVQQCRTLSCREVCGTPCCEGSSCRTEGVPQPCPPGTVCFQSRAMAACLPPPDAGSDVDYDGWFIPDGGVFCSP